MLSLNEIDGFRKNSALREAMNIILVFKINDIFRYGDGLYNDEDTEALHQMRVAARRFKGYLKIFSTLFPKSRYRKIYNSVSDFIRAIGEIRETDVSFEIIDNHVIKKNPADNKILILFISKLKNHKSGLREQLKNNAEIIKFISTKDEIISLIKEGFAKKQKEKFTGFNLDLGFTDNAEIIIPVLRERVMALKKSVFKHPLKKTELHKLRIKAKPLRYAMEMYNGLISNGFDELISETKKFVEYAGAIHDIDVLIPKLNEFIKEIKIYNKRIKKNKDKIATAPMHDLIKNLKIKRRKQFGLICDTLEKWSAEDIKTKISDLIKQENKPDREEIKPISNPDSISDIDPAPVS